VVAMKIHEPTLDLVVGTYGNSCYRINLDAVINRTENSLIKKDFEVNIFPNPAKSQASITFENPEQGQALVQVFDLKGTLVNTIFNGNAPKGLQTITWNTGDQSGNACPDGVYLCRITCGKFMSESKIILMN